MFDYADEPARDVAVAVLGGPGGTSRLDGVFAVGPVAAGARVLRVGDSRATPTLLVPFTATDQGHHLDRPVFLPALESGVGGALPAAVTTTTRLEGDALPGVSLELAGGTAVSLPQGASSEVRVLAVSPSRLPARLPVNAGEPRVAWLVEPHGATFTPAATLRVPRLDPLAAGPFDAWQVSLATGQWEPLAGVALVGSDAFSVPVARGTLVAVVPRAPAATTTLTGRVVAGTQPVAGFRVACWNRVSEPTKQDGSFEVRDVPTSFSLFLARAYPDRPGVDFAASLDVGTSTTPVLGDLVARARAADQIRPRVARTSPEDGQASVGVTAQVVVTFSEPIDRDLVEPFRVVGRAGKVDGRLAYDSAFAVRLVPARRLEPGQSYSIQVSDLARDLSGNLLEDFPRFFQFTTAPGAPAPDPTDTLAFGLSPLSGARGDTVVISGRNFTGGSVVTFGATQGLVTFEATDEVRAQVPDFEPAGDVTVALSAGGVAVGALRPLVLDLRAQVARVLSSTATGAGPSTPLVALDRGAPPGRLVVDGGNVGGAAVTVDGLSIAAVDSLTPAGTGQVATGRTIALQTPAPAQLLTGPVVLRGSNGRAGARYRFLLVREP